MGLATLATLLVQQTKETVYAKGIEVAQSVGLLTTSWHPGDPTRTLFHFVAELLGDVLEPSAVEFVAAGFLDFAVERAKANAAAGAADPSVWLKLLAKQVFDVDVTEATFATGACTLTNPTGGLYDIDPNDITARSSTSNKTYHNTTGGSLTPYSGSGPQPTLTLTFEADEPGSDSTAGAGEIDELVAGPLDVTISNPAALVGLDEEAPDAIAARCRAKLGSLSPNGPADAYEYVALTPELTGTTAVTRARAIEDSDTGDVVLWIAGASAGAVSSGDRDDVEAAILTYATPLCITPTVSICAEVSVDVTYQLWLYDSVGVEEADVIAAVDAALDTLFATHRIGGDVKTTPPGALFHSLIESTIRGVYPTHAFDVAVTAPAADVALAFSAASAEIAVKGTVTPTITSVGAP